VTPEAANGGVIAQIQDGDTIRIDAEQGVLEVTADELLSREVPVPDLSASHTGMGRDLFATFRRNVSGAEAGGSVFTID
jgi:phosphogluconate dehydratase